MDGPEPLVPLRARTNAERVLDVLRSRVLHGGLAPGEHVNEARLAAALGVSRGPVREAVRRLTQEGLLTYSPHKGTRVVELGIADVADVYRARAAVEREAGLVLLDDDALRAPLLPELDGLLGRMTGAVAGGSWTEIAVVDVRFHQTIVDGARSPRLSRIFTALAAETLLCIRRLDFAYPDRERTIDQHRRLADLLGAGDRDGYLTELDWHLRNSVRTLQRATDG